MKDFEVVPHAADLKIRVYGSTMEELFRNALIGMFQSVRPHAESCAYKDDRLVCPSLPAKRKVLLMAADYASLLVDFLSEALVYSDIYNEAYLDLTIIVLDATKIEAILQGVPVQGFEIVEIKAVTYHDLHIKQINKGWQVDIVFDI